MRVTANSVPNNHPREGGRDHGQASAVPGFATMLASRLLEVGANRGGAVRAIALPVGVVLAMSTSVSMGQEPKGRTRVPPAVVAIEPEPGVTDAGAESMPPWLKKLERAEAPELARLARNGRIESLRRAGVPYDRSAPDFSVMDGALSVSNVIGVGQQTHGTHEILEGQFALSRYVIERHGARRIILEDEFMAAFRLNDYVHGRGGAVDAIIRGLIGPWRNDETVAFVEWVKGWNDGHPSDRVEIVGLRAASTNIHDVELMSGLIAKAVPRSDARRLAAPLRSVVEVLRACVSDPAQRSFRSKDGQVIPMLDALADAHGDAMRVARAMEGQLVAKPSKEAEVAFLAARNLLQHVRMSEVKARTSFPAGKDVVVNDPSMNVATYDTVLWANEVGTYVGLAPTRKALFLAHGAHVAAASLPAQNTVEVGAILARMEAVHYCPITFTTHSGTVTAKAGFAGRNAEWLPRVMVPMGADSFEGLVREAHSGKDMVIDMAKTGGWFESPMNFRWVSAFYAPNLEGDPIQRESVARSFDFVVHLDTTSGVVTHDRLVFGAAPLASGGDTKKR